MKNLNIIKKLGLPLATALSLTIVTQTDSFARSAIQDSTNDKIHFLDTANGGDAIIIESNGRFAMIDSGEYTSNKPNTPDNVKTIKAYLNKIGATRLDFFIATHIHSDHIGNIASLIDNGVIVDNIIATSIPEIKYNTTNKELPNNDKNPLAEYVKPIEYMDAVHNKVMQDDWKSDELYRDMLKSFYKQFSNNVTTTTLNEYSNGSGYHILPTENSELIFGDYKLKFNNAFNGYLEDYNNPNNVNNVKVTAMQDTNASSLFISVIDNSGSKFYLSGDGRAENIEELFNTNTDMYKNAVGYKLSHHGANDSQEFINNLKIHNPNIKTFVMSTKDTHSPSSYVLNKNIPLYATNPYKGVHNGHFVVNFSNGKIDTKATSVKYEWEKKNNEWYLKLNNTYIKNQWIFLDDQYYYLDANGRALKNGWHMIDNVWYYFAKKGETDVYGKQYPECAMFSNSWAKDGNDWYYLESSGAMVTNRWIEENHNGSVQWYYVGKDGKMLRGEHSIDGQTYYFAPKSGHTAHSGKKYADGQIYENEWLRLSDGKWKYFKKGGYMAKNETLTIDKVKYKFKNDGTY